MRCGWLPCSPALPTGDGFGKVVAARLPPKVDQVTKWLPMEDVVGLRLKVGVRVERLVTGTIGVTLFVPFWIIDRSRSGLIFRHDRGINFTARVQRAMYNWRNVVVMDKFMTEVAGQPALGKETAFMGDAQDESATTGLLGLLPRSSIHGPEPLMVDYTDDANTVGCLQLQARRTDWSAAFHIDTPHNEVAIVHEQRKQLMFGVSVTEAASGLTKLVTIAPYIMVLNASGRGMAVKQTGTADAHAAFLRSGARMPFHWVDKGKAKMVQVRFDDNIWEWSGSIDPTHVSTKAIRLVNEERGGADGVAMMWVEVRREGASFVLLLRGHEQRDPPYSICNMTQFRIHVYQAGVDGRPLKVLPWYDVDYAWPEPEMKSKLLKIVATGDFLSPEQPFVFPQLYSPDKLGDRVSVFIKDPNDDSKAPQEVVIKVLAAKATRTFLVADAHHNASTFVRSSEPAPRGSRGVHQSGTGTRSALNVPGGRRPPPTRVQGKGVALNVKLKGIALSMVDDVPRELVYASAQEIDAWVVDASGEQALSLRLTKLQIDNQLYVTPYPVLLEPLPSGLPHDKPVALNFAVQRQSSVPGVHFIRSCVLHIAPLDISIDDKLLFLLIDFQRRATAHLSPAEEQWPGASSRASRALVEDDTAPATTYGVGAGAGTGAGAGAGAGVGAGSGAGSCADGSSAFAAVANGVTGQHRHVSSAVSGGSLSGAVSSVSGSGRLSPAAPAGPPHHDGGGQHHKDATFLRAFYAKSRFEEFPCYSAAQVLRWAQCQVRSVPLPCSCVAVCVSVYVCCGCVCVCDCCVRS